MQKLLGSSASREKRKVRDDKDKGLLFLSDDGIKNHTLALVFFFPAKEKIFSEKSQYLERQDKHI